MSSIVVTKPQPAHLAQPLQWRGGAKRIGFGVAGALLALAIGGAAYQAIASMNDARTYPAPGKLVKAGGYRLHINSRGNNPNAPAVILDAGLGMPSSHLAKLQAEIEPFAQVVTYDRAGIGWSDDAPQHDALSNARALHVALQNAGIEPPYIVAGHSMGGMNMLVFANEYRSEVTGIVLIDSEHPDQFQRYGPEHANEMEKILWLGRGLSLISYFGVTRLMDGVQFLAAQELPAGARGALGAYFATPRSGKGIENEVTAWDKGTFPQTRAIKSLGDMPLTVLTAEVTAEMVPEQLAMHREFAALSTRGQHRLVQGADHGSIVIHYAPQVAEAIRELLK